MTENVAPLALRVMGHTELVATLALVGQEPLDVVFDLTGATEALTPLREHCNW